jgi:hypothetical protein
MSCCWRHLCSDEELLDASGFPIRMRSRVGGEQGMSRDLVETAVPNSRGPEDVAAKASA